MFSWIGIPSCHSFSSAISSPPYSDFSLYCSFHIPPTNNLRVLFRLLNPLFDLFTAGNSALGDLDAINDNSGG